MQRRLVLHLAACAGLAAAGGSALLAAGPARAQPTYTVSLAQLQQAVAQRFPMNYPLGGLIDLSLQAPMLRLMPEVNRLGATMAVDAGGPALGQRYPGSFDVDFALRYEAGDKSIRAHRLHFNSLRLADLPPGPSALIEAYGNSLAQQALLEVVVHRLRPQDLALADTMGLEPGTLTVTDKGLVIGFVNKAVQ
jgi:hypothetical protein